MAPQCLVPCQQAQQVPLKRLLLPLDVRCPRLVRPCLPAVLIIDGLKVPPRIVLSRDHTREAEATMLAEKLLQFVVVPH